MMPIQNKQYLLNEVGQATLEETGDINQTYKELAIMAKSIIDDAFETGGYGQWEPLKDNTIIGKTKLLGNTRKKGNINKILIETGQLRRSIKAKVVNI